MSRFLFAVLFYVLCHFDESVSDSCIIPSTNEAGECIPLTDCQGLAEEYKRDRTHSPTICNKLLRKVCCPLRFVPSSNAEPIQQNISSITTVSTTESDSDDSEPFIASQIIKKCQEYKKLLMKNETINSFILGENPTITRVETCHQNKEDVGIASEMEFPHIALIKLEVNHESRRFFNTESKCVGSLISERHVITSFYCVNSLIKFKVTVYLGVFNYDLSDSNLQSHEVESLETKYGVTILRLQNPVVFSEHIMPVCLFPEKVATSDVLLAAWNGDWRECESKLKKWHIRNNEVTYSSRWQITIDQSAIMNYRQTLLPGSPLQIYHPDNTCQYSLIGFFDLVSPGKYVFNSLHRKLRWIEYTVWPKKLFQMNFKTYEVIKNALKL